MPNYDETLRVLSAQIMQKGRYTLKLNAAKKQQAELSAKVATLKKQYQAELADVSALEGLSIPALFYAAIGKKGEKLDKEQAEAFAAKAKYDAAVAGLAAVDGDVSHYQRALKEIAGQEAEYQRCLAAKGDALKQGGSPLAPELAAAEAEIIAQTQQLKEVQEALTAANQAIATVGDILTHLSKAEDWGTWDLLGGGMISDLAKHDHLNTAQNMVQILQNQLRRLKTELADVQVTGDVQVNIEGFLHLADYFFDGLFVDWMVLDKIKNSTAQIKDTKNKLYRLRSQLDTMRSTAEVALAKAEATRKELIIKA